MCLLPHGCFWRCLCVWAGLLGVPVGGGPPASRPRHELRSARRLEARPGPVPRSVPYPQFRMQFPDTCSSSLSEKPGISTITFQSMKCAWGNCMRICADQAPPPLTGTAAWSLYSLWASWGSRVLSFWGARVCVVTNVVNPRCFSCGFLPRCYERRQSEGFFAENGCFWA